MAATYILDPFRLDAETDTLFRGGEPVSLGHRAVALLRVVAPPLRRAEDSARFIESLRKAGLPEWPDNRSVGDRFDNPNEGCSGGEMAFDDGKYEVEETVC